LRESVSSAGERIQVIIEAAEKAAAGIIEDADAQASRYIDTSRQRADVLADERVRVMSDLTDTLIRQAEMVRRQSDELLGALDSARGELASRIGQELSSAIPPPAGVPPAPTQDQPLAQAPRVPHLQPVESERPDPAGRGARRRAAANPPGATPRVAAPGASGQSPRGPAAAAGCTVRRPHPVGRGKVARCPDGGSGEQP